MDLDLDITPRTRGRPRKEPRAEVLRPLTAADLSLMSMPRATSSVPGIKRLRDAHHAMARLIAEGHGTSDVAAMLGYSISRVSILKSDPAFADLVEFYRSEMQSTSIDALREFHARAVTARNLALEVVIDKLEDEPEKVSIDEAMDVATKLADRTGSGPTTKTQSVNVVMSYADALAARRRRTSELGALPAQPEGEVGTAVALPPPRMIEAAE